MKSLIVICFITLMLALPAMAQAATATVNLAWDPMPSGQQWTQVRAYERIGTVAPFTYTLVGTVSGSPPANTVAIPNVAVGTHTYVVRAYNGQSESADSNSVQGVILSQPLAPSTIVITIVVQ